MSFRWRVACALTALALPLAHAQAAHAAGYERVLNGTFDSGSKEPWWSSENTPSRVQDGRLCADVPAGTVNPWDSMIGQNDIPLENGRPYTLSFTASATRDVAITAIAQMSGPPYTTPVAGQAKLTATPQRFEITGTSTVDEPKSQVAFQMGGATEPYTLCLDEISFVGGVVPPGGVRDLGSPVRVNQLGYLVGGPKRATIVTDAGAALTWRLLKDDGTAAATGTTKPHGPDAMSGDTVQTADFTKFRTPGTYRLQVGDDKSEPFAISRDLYGKLRRDALAYFYHNRSGIPIEAKYAGEAYARPAGHLGVAPNQGDTDVPCQPGACDYRMDVRGGWYDAGDHGKYVVNGALAAWQLIDLYLGKVTTVLTTGNFSWRDTGGLADLALARVITKLDPVTAGRLVVRVAGVADRHLADLRAQGYANPFLPADGKYVWGSNSATANEAMVLAYAYDLTRLPKYRDGALESLDYLLGRNALNQSYVTGYGERSSQNQHHRFWAHQLDPALPHPAPGSLAGGPNSGLQDPVAQRVLQGCAPAKCYIDDIGSYSTNEVAVNWNSALAWLTGFADTQGKVQQ